MLALNKRKASGEDGTKSNEPVQKYSRTNVKSGSISTCTITQVRNLLLSLREQGKLPIGLMSVARRL